MVDQLTILQAYNSSAFFKKKSLMIIIINNSDIHLVNTTFCYKPGSFWFNILDMHAAPLSKNAVSAFQILFYANHFLLL